MECCLSSLCTMTAFIFSMVTGRPPVRTLLHKPSKALALKHLQRRGICSYFKPAVIQIFTFPKKHDLQETNKAVTVCQSNLFFFGLLAGGVGNTRFDYSFPSFKPEIHEQVVDFLRGSYTVKCLSHCSGKIMHVWVQSNHNILVSILLYTIQWVNHYWYNFSSHVYIVDNEDDYKWSYTCTVFFLFLNSKEKNGRRLHLRSPGMVSYRWKQPPLEGHAVSKTTLPSSSLQHTHTHTHTHTDRRDTSACLQQERSLHHSFRCLKRTSAAGSPEAHN